MAIRFSGNQWMHTEKPINIEQDITIETLLSLEGDGDNPTIICLPISDKWEKPFLSYRLGFKDKTRKPEFEFLLEGQDEPVSIEAPDAADINNNLHVAGTYNGEVGILYVNGKEVARKGVEGKINHSEQPCVFGGRSKTSPGGYLIAFGLNSPKLASLGLIV